MILLLIRRYPASSQSELQKRFLDNRSALQLEELATNIRERAKQIGAQLEIWSELGVGTEIELSIPGSIAYGVFTTKGSSWIFPKKREQDHEHQS